MKTNNLPTRAEPSPCGGVYPDLCPEHGMDGDLHMFLHVSVRLYFPKKLLITPYKLRRHPHFGDFLTACRSRDQELRLSSPRSTLPPLPHGHPHAASVSNCCMVTPKVASSSIMSLLLLAACSFYILTSPPPSSIVHIALLIAGLPPDGTFLILI